MSYFNNLVYIISQLTDDDMLHLAVTEGAKIVPYIITSRQAVKHYLKVSPLGKDILMFVNSPHARNAWSYGQVLKTASG